MADDMQALNLLSRDPAICDLSASEQDVRLLWSVAQIRISKNHGERAWRAGRWFSHFYDTDQRHSIRLNGRADQPLRPGEGDLDTLSTHLAHIRTWTYVANRNDWLDDPSTGRNVAEQLKTACRMPCTLAHGAVCRPKLFRPDAATARRRGKGRD